jgi:hypothetical protein
MYQSNDHLFAKIFLSCIDRKLLAQTITTLRHHKPEMSDQDLMHIYMADPVISAISPNAFFDEQWYRLNNPDIQSAIAERRLSSGFIHYINAGIFEGRWPTGLMQSMARPATQCAAPLHNIDNENYLSRNTQARRFIEHFPILTPLAHYNAYGRFLGMLAAPAGTLDAAVPASGDRQYFEIMAEAFDPEWYVKTYIAGDPEARFQDDPLSHYLIYGIPRGHSPSAAFDEGFYRAFYPEIRLAIEKGDVPCGFYHYIVAGREEGRLPAYDRRNSLEAWAPGVTRPVLLERVPEIRTRLQPPNVKRRDANTAPRIWVLLPTINPDITFGGYRSVLELIRRLYERGHAVTIVCTEDGQANKAYFIWRESSEKFQKILREIEVIGPADGHALNIGPADKIIVYSLWDLYAADHIRAIVPGVKIILLAQEFEPIFYENSAARAMIEEAYRIDHYPLINSNFLQRYFEAHRIGVFGKAQPAKPGADYCVFEHRINRLAEQSAKQINARRDRVLVAYARPESHAARNMFELLVLALRELCAEGLFGPEWRFIGLGALTEIEPIPIGGAHRLVMYPKMSESEYIQHTNDMDIGVSLMYAPHPSVMPFEFATTGALVVTNAYENRSAEELAAICPNIIAGRPTIEGIAGALREAVSRVSNAKARIANIYRPKAASWDDIFDDALLQTVFGPASSQAAPRPRR